MPITENAMRLPYNATLYKIKDGANLTSNVVKNNLFKGIDAPKREPSTMMDLRQSEQNQEVQYAYRIYRFAPKYPSFLKECDDETWKVHKVGYLIYVQYDGYAAIIKQNIPSISDFVTKYLQELDYDKLKNSELTTDTIFKRFHVNNIDASPNVMRAKTLEAENLQNAFSPMGANRYYLKALKGEKIAADGKVCAFSVALSSSKVRYLASTGNIEDVCAWVKYVVENYKKDNANTNSLLSNFAEYVPFESIGTRLKMTSLLLLSSTFNRLEEDLEYKLYKGDNLIEGEQYIQFCSQFFKPLEISQNDAGENIAMYDDVNHKFIKINVSAKNIWLTCSEWNDYFLQINEEDKITFTDLINSNNDFQITFEKYNNKYFVYTMGKLFSDHLLLANTEEFATRYITALANMTSHMSEKGIIASTDTNFGQGTVFNLVEETYKDTYEHFILDDMGTEFADHIGVKAGEVAFFVEKAIDNSGFSASAFQDVVGQALKNLGNMILTDSVMARNERHWKTKYRETNIARVRKGNLDDALTMWKESASKFTFVKRMVIVVTFLSKNDFCTYWHNVRHNVPQATREEMFQQLWILSSFVAACKEAGVIPEIVCRP